MKIVRHKSDEDEAKDNETVKERKRTRQRLRGELIWLERERRGRNKGAYSRQISR